MFAFTKDSYGKYLWVFKLLGTGRHHIAMMVYCNLMVTTMVDSNEMFVNEAIHQGTDMRHPMCPNAIFRDYSDAA